MSEISIHASSSEQFVERLHEAFLFGDDQAARKLTESRHVLLLQQVYRALAKGDYQPAIANMADDIELELLSPADVPITGCWRGVTEVGAAVQRNFALLMEQQAKLLDVVAQGDTVALFAEERGKVRGTGCPYGIRWVQFFTIRNDKITRIRGIASTLPE